MGTHSSLYKTKKETVNHELRSFERGNCTVLDYAITPQGYYAAIKNPKGVIFLVTSLVKRYKGDYFVKNMTEGMGPSMNDCPTRLFNYCEAPNEYAENFRKKCKEKEEFMKKHKKWTPSAGESVFIYGKKYIISTKIDKHFIVISLENNRRHRAKKYQMVKSEENFIDTNIQL